MIALNVIPDLKGGCGMDRKWVNWNDDATEKSVFEYDGAEVICKTFVKDQIISEIIFSASGAPKSGKIFEHGNAVKEFNYNELGQVVAE